MKPHPTPPAPGQESVWDYPRPPRLEATSKHIRIVFNRQVIADTRRAYRVLETSHPPVYYLPPEDLASQYLMPAEGGSWCEWKGAADYWTLLVDGRRAERVAWSYQQPTAGFALIAGYLAFYAGLLDACTVDGAQVTPQPGGFYGGWITGDIVGPFKGEPGTWGW